MRTGAVFFVQKSIANTLEMLEGKEGVWASISGEKAWRISSIHELKNDVLWFTNLNYNDFYRSGLQNKPNFRNESWLRSLFNQFVVELGVDKNSVSPDITVSTIAAIVQRVVTIAIVRYGVFPESKRLSEDFAKKIKIPQSILPNDLYKIFNTAANRLTSRTVLSKNSNMKFSTITVRCNRLCYARTMLATPVPSDTTEWEMDKITTLNHHNDEWLEGINMPFLVKCTINNINPEFAEILLLNRNFSNEGEWLTDIEWRVIRKYSNISINEILICKKPAILLQQAKLLPQYPLDELSFTYGLIAEQIWTAITNKQICKDNVNRYTIAAVWLRAADRILMFDYARKFSRAGINVIGYGLGHIVLSYPDNELRYTLSIAIDSGLMPPSSKLAEIKE